jgi:hypothetical protein
MGNVLLRLALGRSGAMMASPMRNHREIIATAVQATVGMISSATHWE